MVAGGRIIETDWKAHVSIRRYSLGKSAWPSQLPGMISRLVASFHFFVNVVRHLASLVSQRGTSPPRRLMKSASAAARHLMYLPAASFRSAAQFRTTMLVV